MNQSQVVLSSLAVALVLAGPAYAEKDGKTLQGEEFVTGGVGGEEQAALKERLPQYSLWIQTAAKAGPFLSGASVTITDQAGRVVLDTPLDGPWLMVKLALGEYKVTVTYGGRTEQRSTRIHVGDHHQMVVYFDESVELLPKG